MFLDNQIRVSLVSRVGKRILNVVPSIVVCNVHELFTLELFQLLETRVIPVALGNRQRVHVPRLLKCHIVFAELAHDV